jgi:hypothetical protein
MPYSALCTTTSNEDSAANPQRTARMRGATLHRAARGTGEWVPIKGPEKPRETPIFNLGPNAKPLVGAPVP